MHNTKPYSQRYRDLCSETFSGVGEAQDAALEILAEADARADSLAVLLRHIADQPRMPERVLSGDIRETITLFEDDIARIDAALAEIGKA